MSFDMVTSPIQKGAVKNSAAPVEHVDRMMLGQDSRKRFSFFHLIY